MEKLDSILRRYAAEPNGSTVGKVLGASFVVCSKDGNHSD